MVTLLYCLKGEKRGKVVLGFVNDIYCISVLHKVVISVESLTFNVLHFTFEFQILALYFLSLYFFVRRSLANNLSNVTVSGKKIKYEFELKLFHVQSYKEIALSPFFYNIHLFFALFFVRLAPKLYIRHANFIPCLQYLVHLFVSQVYCHHRCRSKTSRVSVNLLGQKNLQTIAQREDERSMKVQQKITRVNHMKHLLKVEVRTAEEVSPHNHNCEPMR